jgi:hypothetical protein
MVTAAYNIKTDDDINVSLNLLKLVLLIENTYFVILIVAMVAVFETSLSLRRSLIIIMYCSCVNYLK